MDLTLGEKIRLLREERELNQTQLGEKVNMTQRKISYLERDKYEPGVEDIKALRRFFQVSADYLLLPYPKGENERFRFRERFCVSENKPRRGDPCGRPLKSSFYIRAQQSCATYFFLPDDRKGRPYANIVHFCTCCGIGDGV